MPVRSCNAGGKPGYKCGNSGKCYTYSPNDEASRKRAKKKAINQCLAIDEPVSESDLKDAEVSELDIKIQQKLTNALKTSMDSNNDTTRGRDSKDGEGIV